jgi:hypothetical protein
MLEDADSRPSPLSGDIVIRGIRLTVFNVTTTVLVDENGRGPHIRQRSAPRDQYPRRVANSRVAPKNSKVRYPLPGRMVMQRAHLIVLQRSPPSLTLMPLWRQIACK